MPRGDVLRIALLGVIGFGCYQILWPVALQSIPAGDSALLIAATPVITALLAMATGADSPNAVKLLGAFVSFGGVALVIARGSGTRTGRVARRRRVDAPRGSVLGGLHRVRREDPATPLAAGHDDLGGPRRDAVHRARRDRAAGDGRSRPGGADHRGGDPVLGDPGSRASPTSSSSTRSSCSARPG